MRCVPTSALLIVVLACGCARVATGVPAPTTRRDDNAWLHSAETWPRVSDGLRGRWLVDGDAREIEAHLVANDSALLQTWRSGGGETLNVFHPDGDTVVLVHYCAQGNQATLRARSTDTERIVFEQERVTNLRPDAAALCRLEIVFEGDVVRLREQYCDAAGRGAPEEVTTRRAPSRAGPSPSVPDIGSPARPD